MKRALSAAIAIASIVAVMAGARPASASTDYQIYTLLSNNGDQLCMATSNGSTANGAAIVQAPCAGFQTAWIAVPKPGSPGIFWLANEYTLTHTSQWKCLNVKSNSLANGAVLIQWPCGSAAHNDLWTPGALPTASGGTANHTVPNYLSGKCVNIPNNSFAEGTQLIQYTCGTGNQDNDLWTFTEIGVAEGTAPFA
jgi:hypothetical protein